jgi:hypothetical protein
MKTCVFCSATSGVFEFPDGGRATCNHDGTRTFETKKGGLLLIELNEGRPLTELGLSPDQLDELAGQLATDD